MKKCTKCKKNKELTEYHLSKSSKDGYATQCRKCRRDHLNKRYREDPHFRASKLAKQRARRIRNIQHVYAYLQKSKCIDCGIDNWRVLQFDHVRGIKNYGIYQMVSRRHTLEAIDLEIEKCEVRCANCHILKTAQQFNWMKNHWEDFENFQQPKLANRNCKKCGTQFTPSRENNVYCKKNCQNYRRKRT
jgi:hypothetical protein